MLILLFIILWLIIWNCLIERDLKRIRTKLYKKNKFFNKKLKNLENNQNILFDYINDIYFDLERFENNEED